MFHIFYLNRGYMLRFEAPSALGSIYDIQKLVFFNIQGRIIIKKLLNLY
jgi:hypothetical protein